MIVFKILPIKTPFNPAPAHPQVEEVFFHAMPEKGMEFSYKTVENERIWTTVLGIRIEQDHQGVAQMQLCVGSGRNVL